MLTVPAPSGLRPGHGTRQCREIFRGRAECGRRSFGSRGGEAYSVTHRHGAEEKQDPRTARRGWPYGAMALLSFAVDPGEPSRYFQEQFQGV